MIKVCEVCGKLYYNENQFRKNVCKGCYHHVQSYWNLSTGYMEHAQELMRV
jgi:hypothetical protein